MKPNYTHVDKEEIKKDFEFSVLYSAALPFLNENSIGGVRYESGQDRATGSFLIARALEDEKIKIILQQGSQTIDLGVRPAFKRVEKISLTYNGVFCMTDPMKEEFNTSIWLDGNLRSPEVKSEVKDPRLEDLTNRLIESIEERLEGEYRR